MAGEVTATDAELPKPVNVVFQADLLRNAKAVAPYFTGSQGASLNIHQGTNSVKWRRIENLTAVSSALTEFTTTVSGFDRVAAQPSVTDVEAAVLKYGNYILLSEEADIYNWNTQDAKLVEILGINAGESLDKLQRDIVEDNSGISFVGGVASDGLVVSAITAAALNLQINTLVRNNAIPFAPMSTGSTNVGTLPVLKAFWGLCHPDVAFDISGLTGFISVEKYAGQVQTMPGEFGLYQRAGVGVRFIQTTDASVDSNLGGDASSNGLRGSTGADLYSTVVYGQEAMGAVGLGQEHIKEVYTHGDPLPTVQLIIKGRGSAGAADPFDEIMTMAWKAFHTGAVLNTAWIQAIRSGATAMAG